MTSRSPIRVFAVDDHPMILEGFASVLEDEQDFQMVGQAHNGKEAVEQYAALRPHVTLMDLRMPVMDGVEAITTIRRSFPDSRFIVFTTYRGDIQALRALRAGALGYLLKSMIRQDLLNAIRTVHDGRRCIPPEIAAELAEHIAEETLTTREIEILRSVAAGRGNKMIGARLAISEATVKKHLRTILSKLGASDRTHAVTIAARRGYLDL